MQPFDFLISGMYKLYFEKDVIPAELKMKDDDGDYSFLSEDGLTYRRYLIYLAQTSQVRDALRKRRDYVGNCPN